jgi:hypothetical protein
LGYMAVCRDFPFARSSHSLPFRSTSGESELLACAGATAPLVNAPIGYAAVWHEGTADATLLTSLRGWACGFASGTAHNTHCPFGRSFFAST